MRRLGYSLVSVAILGLLPLAACGTEAGSDILVAPTQPAADEQGGSSGLPGGSSSSTSGTNDPPTGGSSGLPSSSSSSSSTSSSSSSSGASSTSSSSGTNASSSSGANSSSSSSGGNASSSSSGSIDWPSGRACTSQNDCGVIAMCVPADNNTVSGAKVCARLCFGDGWCFHGQKCVKDDSCGLRVCK